MIWQRVKFKNLLRLGAIALAGLLLAIAVSTQAQVEPRLERIARTGVLVSGTRADIFPFESLNPDGQWVGYSVDLLELIRQDLEQQLSTRIRLETKLTSMADQTAKIQQGDVDLVCGATSINLSRQSNVDFSVGYFVTGTQFLMSRDNGLRGGQLRIGVIPRSTNETVVAERLPIARTIEFADRAAGMAALSSGRIDALASDGVLLEGMRRSLSQPDQFELVPAQTYSREIYGCILPKNDPAFREVVNRRLVKFMQGVVDGDRQSSEIYERWFGATGAVPMNQTELFGFFRQTIAAYSQHLPSSASSTPSTNS